MNRRRFNLQLSAAAAAATLPVLAQAQGNPVEGTHYVRLNTPAPVTLPADKKIEVVEFFWYECPHCNVFEPMLEAWFKKLPPDVAFRQVPVGFSARHQIHQRLFYALEEMGLLPTLHWQMQRFTQQTGVAVDFKHSGLEIALPPPIAIAAYRIVQEALTNIARHAATPTATVWAWASDGLLKLTIEDQGRGFDPAALYQQPCNDDERGAYHQHISTAMAVASPPPIHSEAMPRLPPPA